MSKIEALWDITKGLPHAQAWFCNKFGEFKKNGNFIAWPKGGKSSIDTVKCCVPGGNLAAEEVYIAKVYQPYIREATFDYAKQREFPVDLSDKLNKKRVERKISRILQNLGVAYIDRAKLIFATNNVSTSAWFTDYLGKEGIAINPWILLQTNMQYLTRMVKREVIHRALYRNLSELSNKIILNFTLDVLSMRIIAQTPYEKLDKITVRLAEKLFNPKIYKQFPLLALCDCSLTAKQAASQLPSQVLQIWDELYKPDSAGFLPSLKNIKPSALYFKIKSLIDEIVIVGLKEGATMGTSLTNYPFNVIPSNEVKEPSNQTLTLNDDSVAPEFDKKNNSLNQAVKSSFKPKKFKSNMSYSNSLTEYWNEQIFKKQDFADNRLKEFAKKWRTEKLLEEVEGKLQEILGKDTSKILPYPEELTYDGQIMMALEVSSPEVLPIYWNHDNDEINKKKKVAAFFDLSSSMQPLLPYMVRIVESVEEQCEMSFVRGDNDAPNGTKRGAYGFSSKVIPLSEEDLENMKTGKLKCGVGTSYEQVLQYVHETVIKEDVDIVICFTDGLEGAISDETIAKFNATNKKFYRIYMKQYFGDDKDSIKVTSDLDRLNGESFTLCLPPLDSFNP
jgi:hypothetical protein